MLSDGPVSSRLARKVIAADAIEVDVLTDGALTRLITVLIYHVFNVDITQLNGLLMWCWLTTHRPSMFTALLSTAAGSTYNVYAAVYIYASAYTSSWLFNVPDEWLIGNCSWCLSLDPDCRLPVRGCILTIHTPVPLSGGTAAAAPPPFRPSDPALCGSSPLVTPYYCRLEDLLCFISVSF